MTSDDRAELEQRLLEDPFDIDARRAYAEHLFDAQAWAESLAQWKLLLRQQSDRAGPHLSAALCCARLDDAPGADAELEAARQCEDFDPQDPRLESLGVSAVRKPLRVVAGGRPPAEEGTVVSMSAAGKTRFVDIVGHESVKRTLRLKIIEPFARPGLFARFKKKTGGGVLLYGPPGCGKTMMARAIAVECDASFTAVGISDILNMWHGESERNLASIFDRARSETPAVLFFDELDALAFSRAKAVSDLTRTLVNEFLAQLDGMSGDNDRVLILAATNMPWDVDDAMKRPGRFDRQIFVPPPDEEAVAEMFRRKLVDVPTESIDWPQIAAKARHFSGADVDGTIEEAKEIALTDMMDTGQERPLTQADLEAALDNVEPSTLDWLKTARNLVKFGGGGRAYKDVEKYLRAARLY